MDNVAQDWYVGMDISEKTIEFFFLPPDNGDGVHKTMPNSLETLNCFCEELPSGMKVVVAMETGTHSPWMSEFLESRGIKCYVGNARKLAAVWSSMQKSDRNDAEMLARLAKADIRLFCPIKHADRSVRADYAVLKARHALVRSRTSLVNTVRGLLRAFGVDCSDLSVENFTAKTAEILPSDLKMATEGLLVQIKMLSLQIKDYDRKITKLCKKYEETRRLQTIPGIGPVIALAFVLTMVDPSRFRDGGRASSYIGLVPKRDQSGSVDKQLGITKAGNGLLRMLLLQGANYILSRAPDSQLRRFGEKLSARGGKISRRKAKVAMARKLCKIMISMWRNDTDYEAFPARLTKKAA